MAFQTEKYISNFIQNQFPRFYAEEGENFILFVKAYYEWMETENQIIYETRRLLDYRDIDNTLETFLEYFQKKYLYGIPFNVIANKRFLLKHILDVYRSKGTIQCYRLLFKLIYNEDVEVYLPGVDVLRVSDGTWEEPTYLEVSENDYLPSKAGKTIIGLVSGTQAVIESVINQSFGYSKYNIVNISNISPKGSYFEINEKIVVDGDQSNSTILSTAPIVIGSLDTLNIINGGQNFAVGDLIKVAHTSPTTGNTISYGVDGILKITSLSRGYGSLNFNIINGGFGYLANANVFIYRNDTTGSGASFTVGSLTGEVSSGLSSQYISYNTDLICDYANLTLNSTTFGFPGNTSANLGSTISPTLSFTNSIFGSIGSLSNIRTGNGYTNPATIFVRSVTVASNTLPGTISYNTTSNTITGTSTIFDSYFANGDVIALQANTSNSATKELAVIRTVTNSTQIILYGPPTINSTASAVHRAAPIILQSNFATYEGVLNRVDGQGTGNNEIIYGLPSVGNSVVSTTSVINSGKGYVENETVYAYLFGTISNNITIISAGSGYTANDKVIISGGEPSTFATANLTVNGSGSVTSINLINPGSGYLDVPTIKIQSNTGSGAVFSASIQELDTAAEIIGKVVKSGVGKGRGYWSTTRSFLNSDKYIQDSYYYQDYSYEIKVARALDTYRDILYETFHTAGTELFGQFYSISAGNSTIDVLYNTTTADTTANLYLTSDMTVKTADVTTITVDRTSISF
jgi:hypothetical protein